MRALYGCYKLLYFPHPKTSGAEQALLRTENQTGTFY